MKYKKYLSLNPLYFNSFNKLPYDNYRFLTNGKILVGNHGKYGVIADNKEVIIPIVYNHIVLINDLYVAEKSNKNYDIYQNSNLVFEDVLQYQVLDSFIVVSKEKNIYEVYDKSFNFVNDFEYVFDFELRLHFRNDGIFIHQKGKKMGVVNVLGDVILKDKYDEINFVDDLIEAIRKNKIEYFDFLGNKILPHKYHKDDIEYLGKNIFLIKNVNRQKLINKDGVVLRTFNNTIDIEPFKNNFIKYSYNKGNYMDVECNDVFDDDFVSKYSIFNISKDYFIYATNGKEGIIDRYKNVILPPIYSSICLLGEYFIAHKGNEKFLFDKEGKDIIGISCSSILCLNKESSIFILIINNNPYIYDGINLNKIICSKEDFLDNRALMYNNNENSSKYIFYTTYQHSFAMGIIDINGNNIIPSYFDNIHCNDNFIILDGYLLPFHFNENSNLKLSIDNIFYYNIDIMFNDKTITKTFNSLETAERYMNKLVKLAKKYENIDKQQENKIYDLLNSNGSYVTHKKIKSKNFN